MEQIIYSGTLDSGETFSFYCCEKGAIPKGLEKVHELSIQEHGKLACEVPEGKRLAWDRETGVPSWEDIPEATAEELAAGKTEQRKAEINQQLVQIDAATTRPLRAVIAGTGTDIDTAKLTELETEAESLRGELKELNL